MLTQYLLMTFVKVISALQGISTDLQYQNLAYTVPNLNLPAVTRNARQTTSYQSGLANNLPNGLSNYNLPNGLSTINLPNNLANDILPSGLANTIYPNNGFVTNMGYNGNNFQDGYNTLNSAINTGLPSYFTNNMATSPNINRISPNNLPFGGFNYNNVPFTENIPSHAQNMVQNYNIPKSVTNIPENGPRNYNALPSNIPQSNFGSTFYNVNNANSFPNSSPNTLLLNNGGMENVRKSNLQVNNMPLNGLSTLNNIASNLLASSSRANGFDSNRQRIDNGLPSNSLLTANSITTNSNIAPYNNGATSVPNNYGFYQNNLAVPQGMPTNAYNWNNNKLQNNIQGTNSIRNLNMYPPNDGLSMSHNNMVLPVTNIPCTNAYVNKGSIANMPLNTVPQNAIFSPSMQSDMTAFSNGNFGRTFLNSNDFYPNVGSVDALTLQDNWSIPTKNVVASSNNYQLASSLPLNIQSQGSLMNLPSGL